VKRLAATQIKAHFGLSVSRACRLVALQRSTYHYKAAKTDNEADIVNRMKDLIGKHKSWGYPIIHDVLRREGLIKNPQAYLAHLQGE